MISSLFFCQAIDSGYIPVSGGYLLFSAISQRLGCSPVGEMLHTRNEGQFFTLSPLMPDYFWKTYRCRVQKGNILFEKDAPFAFRVSFSDSGVFADFASRIMDTELTLGGAGFRVTGFSRSGENEMSGESDFGDLALTPSFPGVFVDFLLPAGFKSSGRQHLFPVPELFFGSLALRWQKARGSNDVLDKNLFYQVLVGSYSLSSVAVRLKNDQVFRGCVGNVHYVFEGLSEPDRALLSRLAALAPFCGVGYKVAQGMGLVKIRF